MSIEEFKAWLDGYMEASGELPPKDTLLAKLESVQYIKPDTYRWRYTTPLIPFSNTGCSNSNTFTLPAQSS